MAIPGPGTAISMNTIATEFGGTVPHSLSEYYRGGGLVPNTPGNAAIPTSGQIAMGNFYGSANRVAIPLTISSNSYNYDVYTNRGPTYSAGASDITVTVNPGVTVGSTSTGSYAMLVPSSFSPGDTVTIINNGTIQGMGGAGGAGGSVPVGNPFPGSPGAGGGNALYVNRPTTVTNNGTIAGGGGGGGGGGGAFAAFPKQTNSAGGGGGGGGAGFNGGGGGSGGSATFGTNFKVPGSPGGGGTSPAGGGGGAGGSAPGVPIAAGPGGSGGGRGASGSSGSNSSTPGPAPSGGGAGGGAGNYIVGNPFVTWPATGTRQGGVA